MMMIKIGIEETHTHTHTHHTHTFIQSIYSIKKGIMMAFFFNVYLILFILLKTKNHDVCIE